MTTKLCRKNLKESFGLKRKIKLSVRPQDINNSRIIDRKDKNQMLQNQQSNRNQYIPFKINCVINGL